MSATDVQRRQQRRTPHRVGVDSRDLRPAEDSLTKETAQYEKQTGSRFNRTSVFKNIHLKLKKKEKKKRK